jgi:RNA polymerase sigma-70 factor (ECF subfamily)
LLVRRQRAARLAVGGTLAHLVAASEDQTVERMLDDTPERLADALQLALERLGSRYREAFLLKHAEGMEYTQMAEITGASIPALKMRVKRARELLRPWLEGIVDE